MQRFEIIQEYTATEAFEIEAEDAEDALRIFRSDGFDGEAYGGDVKSSRVVEVLIKY